MFPNSDGNVTAAAISADGLNLVIGTDGINNSQLCKNDTPSGSPSRNRQKFQDSVCNSQITLTAINNEAVNVDKKQTEERTSGRSDFSVILDFSPSVILLDLYSLKILHRFKLQLAQSVTAIALIKIIPTS
ncbi:hypothetical protein O6H91_12G011300 [Diphasiastrum complanatum]|uniref:Uncharacterized protein n=1 Tax=Diphasiastrum complanatum TaxID=34168 RepID=A0ACC2BYU0_DIPCM|nr:hypothetical protein O6H91_12G011300 [Diphasiastrum complanatum]